MKGVLAKRGLVRRRATSAGWGSTSAGYASAVEQQVKRLRKPTARVVGDIDELEARPVPGVHTNEVTAEQQLEAALDGLAPGPAPARADRLTRRWSRTTMGEAP